MNCSIIPFFVLSFICLMIICLIAPNLMAVAAMVTIFVNFFNIAFILERSYKESAVDTMKNFVSGPSPKLPYDHTVTSPQMPAQMPADSLLRREFSPENGATRDAPSVPEGGSGGISKGKYKGEIGAHIDDDTSLIPDKERVYVPFSGGYSADDQMRLYLTDRRSGLKERQISGTADKIRYMKRYLEEDPQTVENRDWWGNHDT